MGLKKITRAISLALLGLKTPTLSEQIDADVGEKPFGDPFDTYLTIFDTFTTAFYIF